MMDKKPVTKENSESLRILIFNRDFYQISETFIYRQVLALAKTFEVDLMGFGIRNEAHFQNPGCKFISIGTIADKIERRIRNFFQRLCNIRYHYTWNARVILHYYFKRKRVIVHAHYGWNGLYLLPYLKKKNIPLVVSFHGNDASGWLKKKNPQKKLPELFAYARHIILSSNHMIAKLQLESYGGKVSVIPYGININEFKPSVRSKSGNMFILHIGRLVPKKGVPDLIRVFARLKASHPAAILQIVGEGIEKLLCERLVSELNLKDAVVFFGAQPQAKVKELMNDCDIFVLNSRTDEAGDMEGLPNVILEAMAFEKPVVSTYHAGIPMAVTHEVTGFLVNEFDQESLFCSLDMLMKDETLRVSYGKNGRKKVAEQFTDEIMAESLIRVFAEKISKI